MSVLGATKLWELLKAPNPEDRLFVTPILEDDQIGPASIDIRLGAQFIVTRRGNLPFFDPKKDQAQRQGYQAVHTLNPGGVFYLHPNELVLASTLEYIRLPVSVAGHVTSRSRWGRAGLVIATATAIHPGFTGTITLELINLGEVPLALYPEERVAQLIISECIGGTAYDGSLSYQTGATFASLNET